MSNTPFDPVVPDDEAATREVDGEEVLDTDVEGDQVDSAAADRLASTDPDDEVR